MRKLALNGPSAAHKRRNSKTIRADAGNHERGPFGTDIIKGTLEELGRDRAGVEA